MTKVILLSTVIPVEIIEMSQVLMTLYSSAVALYTIPLRLRSRFHV